MSSGICTLSCLFRHGRGWSHWNSERARVAPTWLSSSYTSSLVLRSRGAIYPVEVAEKGFFFFRAGCQNATSALSFGFRSPRTSPLSELSFFYWPDGCQASPRYSLNFSRQQIRRSVSRSSKNGEGNIFSSWFIQDFRKFEKWNLKLLLCRRSQYKREREKERGNSFCENICLEINIINNNNKWKK